jgi:transcription initiation factor TFIIB
MITPNGICEHCGNEDLIEDEKTGEIICAKCGLVVSKVNLLRPDFVKDDYSTSSKTVSPENRSKINRLMVIDRRLKSDDEEPYVLRVAIREINRLVQSMHLPDTIEKNAENIYRNAHRERLIARGTITGFAAASVYAACRMQGIPRTLNQFSEVSSDTYKDISRMYRILLSELNLSVELDNPLKHLSPLANALDLSYNSEQLAVKILKVIMNNNIHIGKTPKGLAASSLYIACKENKEYCTQKDLSDVAGVSALTIRKHVKKIRENVNIKKLK